MNDWFEKNLTENEINKMTNIELIEKLKSGISTGNGQRIVTELLERLIKEKEKS